MPRCEDYPCCGHEPGDCPRIDKHGNSHFRCVECGHELSRSATSSICRTCRTRAIRRVERGEEAFDDMS